MPIRSEILDRNGLCRASIRSEDEVSAIQAELEGSGPEIEKTLRWLEAVKDPTRFKVVYLLYRHGGLCVCDLANVLGVTDSAISQHLRKLKDMELVSAERRKQTIFHALKDAEFIRFFVGLMAEETATDRGELGLAAGDRS